MNNLDIQHLNILQCPICGNHKYKNIHVKYDLQIVRCLNCSFVFVNNPIIGKKKDSEEHLYNFVSHVKFRHYEIKRLIDKIYRKNNQINIVEIGAGAGALAGLLNDSQKYSYIGFEPLKLRVDYAVSKGYNIKNQYFESKDRVSNVDVIILDNVLEHIYQPEIIMKEISLALKPNGIVIVIVPNLHDLRRFIPNWRKKNYWLPFNHVNYFTFKTLQKLCENNEIILKPFKLTIAGGLFFFINLLLNKLRLFFFGIYSYGIKK